MKKAIKIFAAMSVILLVSHGIFVVLMIRSTKDNFSLYLQSKNKQIEAAFFQAVSSSQIKLLQLAGFVASNPQIQQLFYQARIASQEQYEKEKIAEIRNQLYKTLQPGWQKLRSDYSFRQLHFHFAPGAVSFLRMHRPEKFGDRLDDLRFTVVHANKTKKPVAGLEIGRALAGIRGVVPVFYKDKKTQQKTHVGCVEAGTSFITILSLLKKQHNTDIAILLREKYVRPLIWDEYLEKYSFSETTFGDYLLEASTGGFSITKLAENNKFRTAFKENVLCEIKRDEKHFCAGIFELRDFRGTEDSNIPPIGKVIMLRNTQKEYLNHKAMIRNSVTQTVISYGFFELILAAGISMGIRTMKEIVNNGREDLEMVNTKLKSDIQRRLAIEKALKNSEKKYRSLVDNLNVGIALINPDFQIVSYNSQMQRWFRINENPEIKKCYKLLARDQCIENIEECPAVKCFRDGQVHQVQLQYSSQSNVRFCKVVATPIKDEQQNVTSVIQMVEDITEEKQHKTELERFRAALNTSAESILMIDPQKMNFIDMNQTACTSLGYSREEMLTLKPWNIEKGVDNKKIADRYKSLIEDSVNSKRTNTYYIRKNKTEFPVEICFHSITIESGKLIIAVARDISESKQIKDQLKKNLRFMKTLLDTIPSPVFYKDSYGIYKGCNKAFQEFVGMKKSQIIDHTVYELAPRDIAQGYYHADMELICKGGNQIYETKAARNDGSCRDVIIHKATYQDNNGNIEGIVGVISDITDHKTAERAKSHLAAIVESTSDAIISKDLNGKIISWNKGAQNLYGYEASEVLGRNISLLADQKKSDEIFNIMKKIEQGSEVIKIETTRKRKDGNDIDIILTLSPIRDSQGNMHAISAIAHDITERKTAERALICERSLLRSLIDSIPDLIFYKDTNCIYLGCNQAFGDYAGLSKEQISGRNDFDLFDKETAKSYRHNDKLVITTGLSKHNEEWINYPSGKKILLDTLKTPFSDENGKTVGVIGISRNITSRKTFERELQAAKKAAEKANLAKSLFLANMSHELRTPLHGILSFANFGINKYKKEKPEKIKEYFERINQSGQSLLLLLNDLLDLAKLESGRMVYDFTSEDIVILIRSVVDEFRSLLSEKNIGVIYQDSHEPIFAKLDAGKIRQVVRNLLSNAVKFSPDQGRIFINLEKNENMAQISVRDQGPGIPTPELEDVFDKFVQSSKTRTNAGGTGLGLAICKEIITAHKGHIWAQDTQLKGALLIFTLPIEEQIKEPNNVENNINKKNYGGKNESQTQNSCS